MMDAAADVRRSRSATRIRDAAETTNCPGTIGPCRRRDAPARVGMVIVF
jgi:hypothetical protein